MSRIGPQPGEEARGLLDSFSLICGPSGTQLNPLADLGTDNELSVLAS